jgi:hypothetical protein
MGDHIVSINPDRFARPAAPIHHQGRGLFLGHYMGPHYGHFITETLSTFWILEENPAESYDYFVFYPYIFGCNYTAYVRFCLEAFGIDESKIVFIGDEFHAFDELTVPARLLRLNHSADAGLRWVYENIASHGPPAETMPTRLYLSRRRFSRRRFERVVANEVHIERTFEDYGFKVIYPEEVPFPIQVALYSRAEAVAGISGSGLHNSVFMRPDRLLIELGDPRYSGHPAPTQVLCNSISGVRSHFIPFAGHRFGPRFTMLFDIQKLRQSLGVLLRQPSVSSPATSLAQQLLDLSEIAYRSARPTVGWVAQGCLAWLRGEPYRPLKFSDRA